jgi:hypothetical protein
MGARAPFRRRASMTPERERTVDPGDNPVMKAKLCDYLALLLPGRSGAEGRQRGIEIREGSSHLPALPEGLPDQPESRFVPGDRYVSSFPSRGDPQAHPVRYGSVATSRDDFGHAIDIPRTGLTGKIVLTPGAGGRTRRARDLARRSWDRPQLRDRRGQEFLAACPERSLLCRPTFFNFPSGTTFR